MRHNERRREARAPVSAGDSRGGGAPWVRPASPRPHSEPRSAPPSGSPRGRRAPLGAGSQPAGVVAERGAEDRTRHRGPRATMGTCRAGSRPAIPLPSDVRPLPGLGSRCGEGKGKLTLGAAGPLVPELSERRYHAGGVGELNPHGARPAGALTRWPAWVPGLQPLRRAAVAWLSCTPSRESAPGRAPCVGSDASLLLAGEDSRRIMHILAGRRIPPRLTSHTAFVLLSF